MGDRLSQVEARLSELEALASAEAPLLEGPTGGGSGAAALAEYQRQMLARLVVIRDALVSGDGDVTFVVKERDALREENAKLKKEAEKLNYRIAHLVKHVP